MSNADFSHLEGGAKSAYDRLMRKIERIPFSGCWIFTGSVNNHGYGYFMVNSKKVKAHRASWILHRSEVPEGLFVLHHCDVPSCVNPNHLFLGTRKDNSQDMVSKRRHVFMAHPERIQRGEKSAISKISDAQAAAIWERISRGERSSAIAQDFGITRGAVNHIKSGRTWKHLTEKHA